jgi:hypothetical protein
VALRIGNSGPDVGCIIHIFELKETALQLCQYYLYVNCLVEEEEVELSISNLITTGTAAEASVSIS